MEKICRKMNGINPVPARKASSPQAPPFMVSAPGKVIVFGEHAVAHGKSAMAAAISLRSYLLVTSLSKSHRTIALVFSDLDLDHTWNIEELPWELAAQAKRRKKYYDLVTSLDPELVEAMQPHLSNVSSNLPEKLRATNRTAAASFLYLFLSLSSPTAPACIYTLRSTLPIGGGVGSSASISVCISAALLKQIHVLAGPHEDQPPEEVKIQVERINRWAFVSELCIHGRPSGVDNTVSTRGQAVLFRRPDYEKPPEVTPLPNFPLLPLLLINTNQSRSTAAQLEKVKARKDKYPKLTETTLEAIDEITKSAGKLISSSDFSPRSEDDIQHLGELFQFNHGHLESLGVSHPKLDRIREMVDYAGIGWTKLTGAGGGGCAITLLKGRSGANGEIAAPSNADRTGEAIEKLHADLKKAGFDPYSVTLGGDGVGILYPAVLRNGSDEAGGEEIDQQKFLKADGPDEIERLVGVGVQEKRDEWKFWRQADG